MQDNKTRAPMEYYQARYAALNPGDAALRAGVSYDAGVFTLTALGHTLCAAWPEFALSAEACPAALLGSAAQILFIRYLLEGVRAPFGGKFLSYRELPWGPVYDANFQGRCLKRLAFAFGNRPEAFARACEKLRGTPCVGGDAAYELAFLENARLRLILYRGDDEFPPSAQILFSDNTATAFTAEDLAAVGDVVIGALTECAE